MKKSLFQTTLSSLRKITPLAIRQQIGPILAKIWEINRINRPHIFSIDETIDILTKTDMSMIRFGDGEISIVDGESLPFQKHSDYLAYRLQEIITSFEPGLLICIPGMWDLSVFEDYARKFINHHLYRYKHVWDKVIYPGRAYGDTNVTRHYLAYKDKSKAKERFDKIKSVWEGKSVILIEGEKSRLGVGNDLFDGVSSLKRILFPAENAFGKVLESHFVGIDIILLSLGPAAKVLGYDLYKAGYRVIDIGHIDMEYEMFLRGETKQVKVPGKYFNEINERNPEDCTDEKYLSQIIEVIK